MADARVVSDGELVALIAQVDARARGPESDGTGFGVVLLDVDRPAPGDHDGRTERLASLIEVVSGALEVEATMARVGTGQLAVVLPQIGPAEVQQIARRVRRAVIDASGEGARWSTEVVVVARGGPTRDGISPLWAARDEVDRERRRPLVERVHRLESVLELTDGVEHEITALSLQLDAALDAAHRDGLTGLRNRVGSELLLESAPAPFALAFVDLDDLRGFNSSEGLYEAGDEAIRRVARAVAGAHHAGVAGRWGGDEFVVVAPGVTVDDLHDRLEEALRSVLAEPPIAGRVVSFSAGVVEVPDPGGLDTAQARAQAILQHIKQHDLRPAVQRET